MSSPRSATADLGRLLNSVSSPLYVVDDQRRIVFCNQAAAEWAEVDPSQIVGQRCNYHSPQEGSGAEGLPASLCPPPEVFHGQRVSGRVTIVTQGGPNKSRQAEFIPLTEGEASVAVLVLLATDDRADALPSPSANGEAAALHDRLRRFRHELQQRHGVERLVGDSPAARQARAQVALAAASRATVLIIGPRGSGRKDVARAIHYGANGESSGALVPLSCAALGAELLRSTIAAIAAKSAMRQSLDRGTLLLNDIEEAPAEAQTELAALLSATTPGPRIIATTHEPLGPRVLMGSFRSDLAAALATLVIHLPALSKRREDLPLVAQMLLEEINAQGKKQLRGFTADALDALSMYAWPGNVVELEQIVREAHTRAEGFEITAADLPKRIRLSADVQSRPRRREEPIDLEKFLAQVETELIRRAMTRAKGNKSRAAKLLGMTRPRLYRRMVQLGLVDADKT